MYLTCFRVNTARQGARKLLSSPQSMHAAVMSGFPGILPSDTDVPRVLWRLDRNARAEVLLYIVSPDRPDLTHLVEQAGWPTAGATWRTQDYAPLLSRLKPGEVWGFRLTANPSHQVRTSDDQKETKRTAHVTWRQQVGWLLERQETSGFRVVRKPAERQKLPEGDEYELVVRDRRRVDFGKRRDDRGGGRRNGGHDGSRRRVQLSTATYDGRLEVTDPAALRRTLTEGLGRAKAYGCGLMTLAPVGGSGGGAG